MTRLRACWVAHSAVGGGGDAEDVYPPCGDLHYDQRVQPPQRDGVDMQEVGRQQPGRLRSQEGPPVGVDLAGRRADSAGGEDPADGAGADPVAQTDQFALHPAVPQPGFSRASRRTRSRISLLIRGRPGRFG
jgi:hypothetical protein